MRPFVPSLANIVVAAAMACSWSASSAAADREALARMPDGTPDIQGIWTSGTLTPYERPPELADKAQLTPAQTAERQAGAVERFWGSGHRPDDVGRDNDAFIDDHLRLLPNGQTSLVVFPLDGRYPLKPEAERRRDFNLENADTYATMSQWDRCITREPTALFPVIYNNAYQIVQTATHVVIAAEMIHDARIVALGGARVHSNVRSWGGDPRGHWEGSTLVVDTTNFNDRGWIATGQNAGRVRGVPYSRELHIVERFTPLDAKTLSYEITIEDPQMYTSAWQLAFPLHRDDSYRIYEYACHEGNAAVELILRGARAQEALKPAR